MCLSLFLKTLLESTHCLGSTVVYFYILLPGGELANTVFICMHGIGAVGVPVTDAYEKTLVQCRRSSQTMQRCFTVA